MPKTTTLHHVNSHLKIKKKKRQHGSLNKQYFLLPYPLQAKDNGVEIDALVKENYISFSKAQWKLKSKPTF